MNNYQEENLNQANPYDDAYNSSQPVTYEEEKKPINYKLIAIIILILLLLFFLLYFIFFRGNKGSDAEYNKLVTKLCEASEQYISDNPELIDKDTPGATAYVKLQKLSEAYLIESEIKDPRYKRSLFGKSKTAQYIPMTAYIRLAVASNSQVYCEGLVDTGDDKTSPIITLVGSGEITIAKGTNFEDPGAKASDDMDGDLTSKISRSGTVDTTKVGEYTIQYTVTDTSGNTTTIKRNILVKEYSDLEPSASSNLDTIAPQIEIKGNNPLCLKLGDTYVEPGVTAIDNKDGNITGSIVVSNGVTGNRTGVFRVTYSVEDSAGNKTMAYRSVEVKTSCVAVTVPKDPTPVNAKPTISLIGGTSIVLEYKEEYVDRGATAWDKEDGNITNKIKVDSTEVNVNSAGIYTVYYEVIDSSGAKATTKRTVTVKAPNVESNVATFSHIPSNVKVEVGTAATLDVPTAKDSHNKTVAVVQEIKNSSGSTVSDIDYYNVGSYVVVYTAKPEGGVSQTVSRTVNIVDTTSPSINTSTAIVIAKRTTNCELTPEDLINSGVVVSDGLNKKLARLRIKATTTNVCTAGSSKVTVDAVDNSNNVSYEKAIDVTVSASATGGPVTGASILNCGSLGTYKMNINGTYQLTYAIYPVNATNKNVTWKSLNSSVATVTNGLVKATAVGSTDIIITTADGSKTATCTIVVGGETGNVPVTGVEIQGCESGELNIAKGRTTTLTAQALPSNATNKTVSWTSSNGAVATINEQGVVSTLSSGTTNLTVKTADGSKTKICRLNVLNVENPNDTTAPSKVNLISNSMSATDPYNNAGTWYGGVDKREIKLVVESADPESRICRFEVVKGGTVIATFNPLAENPNRGEYSFAQDINDKINIRAVNCADITGEASSNITLKLDNSGPTIKFTKSLDENSWTNEPIYTVAYQGNDAGIGLSYFEYTYDDVKAVREPSIEGLTETGSKDFYENNTKSYVYVRAVDKLGNVGPWTEKPSYLNMDSVAPTAPTINITNNDTDKVTVGFTFGDNTSTKSSGFGSFEYKLNNEEVKRITVLDETFDLTTDGTHKVEAWSYDKAGNKSETSTIKEDIKVKKSNKSGSGGGTPTQPKGLTITCNPGKIGSLKNSIVECTSNKEVKWTISDSNNYEIITSTTSSKITVKKKNTNMSGVEITATTGSESLRYSLTVEETTPNFKCVINETGEIIANDSNILPGSTIKCTTTSSNSTISCGGNVDSSLSSTNGTLTCKTKSALEGTVNFSITGQTGYKKLTYLFKVSGAPNVDTKLKVNCPSSSIKTGNKITCSLDGSTSYAGVKLSCYNNQTFVRSFTTTSSDKTIYCTPEASGTMTIKAEKDGYKDGTTTINVTGASSTPPKTVTGDIKMKCYKGSSLITNNTHIDAGDTVRCALSGSSALAKATFSCSGGTVSSSASTSVMCKAGSSGALRITASSDGKSASSSHPIDSFKLTCPSYISATHGKTVTLRSSSADTTWAFKSSVGGKFSLSKSTGKEVILKNVNNEGILKFTIVATTNGKKKECTITVSKNI